MSKPRDERQKDLFRPALEQIIDMGHPLVRLAVEMDWGFLERRFASVCATGPGQPPTASSRPCSSPCSPWPAASATRTSRQRGPKVYALHAPEVECISGQARGPRARPAHPTSSGAKSRGHARHLTQGRPVRPPCQGAARKPV